MEEIQYIEKPVDAESRFNHLSGIRTESSDLEDNENFGDWALGTDAFSTLKYDLN